MKSNIVSKKRERLNNNMFEEPIENDKEEILIDPKKEIPKKIDNKYQAQLKDIFSIISRSIISFCNKLKDNALRVIKSMSFWFLVVIGFTTILSVFVTKYSIPKQKIKYIYVSPFEKSDLTHQQKARELEITYNEYMKATAADHLHYWQKKYLMAKYRIKGNPGANEYDSDSAVIHYLWSWGAYVVFENTKEMQSRVEKIDRLDWKNRVIRRSFSTIQTGDIIIIKNGNSLECGIVYRKIPFKNIVMYMSFNSRVGMDFSKLAWSDKKINMIFQPNYRFWIGDLLNEIEEQKYKKK